MIRRTVRYRIRFLKLLAGGEGSLRDGYLNGEVGVFRYVLQDATDNQIKFIIEADTLAHRIARKVLVCQCLTDDYLPGLREGLLRAANRPGKIKHFKESRGNKVRLRRIKQFVVNLYLRLFGIQVIDDPHFFYFRKVLLKNGCESVRSARSVGVGITGGATGNYSVYSVGLAMKRIKAEFKADDHEYDQGTTHAQGESGNVDDREALVLAKVSQGSGEVVLEHVRRNRFGVIRMLPFENRRPQISQHFSVVPPSRLGFPNLLHPSVSSVRVNLRVLLPKVRGHKIVPAAYPATEEGDGVGVLA